MAKKTKPGSIGKSAPTPSKEAAPVAAATASTFDPTPLPQPAPKPYNIFDFRVQAVIVALLAFLFYINTAGNEYAHDDGIVIVKNEYVQEGFAGLHSIFTKDAYDSYYRQLNTGNQLSGGRYRPLSIATFAIEQEFFGAVPTDKIDSFLHHNISYGASGPQEQRLIGQMHVRHVMNVLWYVALVVVLLYFMRQVVFPDSPLAALIATLLFTIHPIHTEVVANVKSRDEIMSLLFMCLTFIFAFKYVDTKKVWMVPLAMLCFFLAFLSKEYAITMAVLLPLSFLLFREASISKSIKLFLPYLLVIFLYLYVRLKIAVLTSFGEDADMTYDNIMKSVKNTGSNADKEILNNPYLYATPAQKLATEIATSLDYIKLLLFPHPLSADYSYDTIPYSDFGSIKVYLSMLVHGLMFLLVGFFAFVKKNMKVVSFALAFYLLHLLLVNNTVFDIGATMGERLIFHSSVGFSIIMALLIVKALDYLNTERTKMAALSVLMGVVTLVSGYITVTRNLDWKNDATLFGADIKTTPNSILVNANVAAACISKVDFEKDPKVKDEQLHYAIGLLDHAIALHHNSFVAGFLNRGIAWYKLGDIDKAKANMDSVKMFYPSYPTLKGMYQLIGDHYMKLGWSKYGQFGKYPEAIEVFKKGLAADSTNADLWYNMGGAYYSNRQLPEAINAWQVSLKLKPGNMQAQQGMQAAIEQLKMMKK